MNTVLKSSMNQTLVSLTLIALISCGNGCSAQKKASAVDTDIAQKTLEEVLTSWKDGETPDAWQQRSPKVVVQDFDWAEGAKLKGFELLGPGEPRDANLYCKVKLMVEPASQPQREKVVTYVVGTDPVLTDFETHCNKAGKPGHESAVGHPVARLNRTVSRQRQRAAE